jgi:rod shape-determining protein MreB and related proteins
MARGVHFGELQPVLLASQRPRMFSALSPIVYIQISAEFLTLKNLKTGGTISEVPELAISAPPKPKILAVGHQARLAAGSQPAEVVNPFAHPRSLVSDFTVAEQLVKHQLRRVLGNPLLSFAPCVVMHPLGSPAGGFTQVERRAFREMALGAGASEVFVWTGRPLTDQEVLSKHPPQNCGEWE